jgi:hypothetical protein
MVDMMAVMSLRRPPGVFIWMTIAGALEDFAIARAPAIRLKEPGSTGTLKSTTRTADCAGAPWALGPTEPIRRHAKAKTNAERNNDLLEASFLGFGMPISAPSVTVPR